MRNPANPRRLVHLAPVLSDEATLELSKWLRELSQRFDEDCHEQILRAHRRRRRDRQRQIEQRNAYQPQAQQPEEFGPAFPWEHP